MNNIMQGLEVFYEKVKYHDLSMVFKMLNRYRYAVVKGAPLKKMIGEGCSALYSDIDILIDRNNLNIITRILNENGFYNDEDRGKRVFALVNSHQALPYSKIYNSNQKVDVNFDIFWGEYEGERVSVENFLEDTIQINIHGIEIKTLPLLKTIIHLALHHYKDMNSIYLLSTRNSINYDMFKDFYQLIKRNENDISVDELYSLSQKMNVLPYVFYVFYHTSLIFEDELLIKYSNALMTIEGESLLDYYGLCKKERKRWAYDFKTRLGSYSLYDLIKNDLTENDLQKIKINRRVFGRDLDE